MSTEINQPEKIKDLVVDKNTEFSNQEIMIFGKIEIKAGCCLNILNSKLTFADNALIVSEGRINATRSSFHAMSVDYGWGGIKLNGDGISGSEFKSCSFKNAIAQQTSNQFSSDSFGGAIHISRAENAKIAIIQCQFENCTADIGGAVCFTGILESNMEPHKDAPVQTIKNCKFIGCKAQQGGAIATMNRAKVLIENCIFEKDSANSGGAIYNYDYCNLNISWCLFKNCSSTVAGGAVTSRFSTNSIGFSTFENCISENGDAQGGALYLEKSNSKVFDSSFTSCQAQAGGAVRPVGGMLTLSTINFVNCLAQVAGAAMATSRDAEINCTNSIFDNCRLTNGSIAGEAVAVMASELILKNCNFLNSSSNDLAVVINATNGSEVSIDNCGIKT
jgi:hypothetical protein